MISVLIPSYNNPEGLDECLWSLAETCLCQAQVEVLVRIDKNDPKVKDYPKMYYTNSYRDGSIIKDSIFLSDSGSGYEKLHIFIDELADRALGDWFLIMTDDSVMETPHWDKKILSFDNTENLVLNPCGDGLNLFPIVSRKMYDVLGHLSLSPHYDTWISTVAHENGRQKRLHNIIDIEHLGPTNDHSETSKHFYSEEMQNLLKKDIERIKKWISNEKAQKNGEVQA